MKASEEFESGLIEILNKKSANKQLILGEGMVDKLMDLLLGLFDQCIGQLTPAQVARRICNGSSFDKTRFRTRVRKNLYSSSSDYRQNGGQYVADSVFEQSAKMGFARCEEMVNEMTQGDNWWPNGEFDMG